MSDDSLPKMRAKTLELRPRGGDEAIKPSELIGITGHHDLTLNARRAITILWHHAHSQGIEDGKDYIIELDELKPAGHKGYEMVEQAVESLMKVLLTVKLSNGQTRRVQLLGPNDIDSPDRPAGCLIYTFHKKLVEILKDSTIWGKIAIPILMSFTSKYSVSLYENLAQVANLSQKFMQNYTVEEFRDLLGVQPGSYRTFGELNKYVIKPAVAEVNALAPFGVKVMPVKRGKKVVQLSVSWWAKDNQALQSAWREIQGSKVGRRARISGAAEYVTEPQPSVGRARRRQIASPKSS